MPLVLLPWLRLLRAGTLFSPAADVVAGLCLAGLPWSPAAAGAVAAGVCAYAGGMVLNDHSDRRRDAVVRPERPIPRGEIAPGAALTFGLALLLAAVLVSPAPRFHATLVLGVLAYDYLFQRHPLFAAPALAALRAANLLSGPAMLAAGPLSGPLWIAAVAYGIYILAVTVLGWLEDQPDPEPSLVRGMLCVPPLASVLALAALPVPWPAAVAAVLGAAVVRDAWRTATFDQAAIRRRMTWLLLGTMVYTALLAAAGGRLVEAVAILTAVPVARRIGRAIAFT